MVIASHSKSVRAKGFSILEVLLSLFVLSVGMVAIVSVLSKSLRYSYDTRDTIIATELAQEGVELVRNVRDNDFVAGGTGFTAFDANKKHCFINWDDVTLQCFVNQNPASRYFLQYAGGLYAHSGVVAERYSRYIYIDFTDNAQGKRATVRSFVFWGAFSVGNIPQASGSPANCIASTTCVYTETFLTFWR